MFDAALKDCTDDAGSWLSVIDVLRASRQVKTEPYITTKEPYITDDAGSWLSVIDVLRASSCSPGNPN